MLYSQTSCYRVALEGFLAILLVPLKSFQHWCKRQFLPALLAFLSSENLLLIMTMHLKRSSDTCRGNLWSSASMHIRNVVNKHKNTTGKHVKIVKIHACNGSSLKPSDFPRVSQYWKHSKQWFCSRKANAFHKTTLFQAE